MTDFLVKLFVKDYQQVNQTEVRTRYGMLASTVGIACNIMLFAAKCGIGLGINSISVTADAFNNLSDASSSIVSFIGVRMAQKPADEDHPFGHGRVEYITAFIIACVILQVAFSLFKTSFSKIFESQQLIFNVSSIIILVISVGVKLWMGLFNRKLGKRIQSKVMLATAADSLGDAVTTCAVIGAIVCFRISGINIDGYIGILVSVAVFLTGLNIAKDTLAPLIGEAIDPVLFHKITEFVEGYDGILGSHDLIVHNYGPSRSMASIHAEVPNDIDIEVSHEIIDRIERDCMREFGFFLVIHMDPVETKDEQMQNVRSILDSILKVLDERISYHDLRMVHGKESINLIFDLVIPRDYHQKQTDELKANIAKQLCECDSRYHCVITVENSFCVDS